jgi:hypothetical protein
MIFLLLLISAHRAQAAQLALGLPAICCLHTMKVQLEVVRTARCNLSFSWCWARPGRCPCLLACVPRQHRYHRPIKGECLSPSCTLAVASTTAALVKSLAIYLFVTAPQRLAGCPSAAVASAPSSPRASPDLCFVELRVRRLLQVSSGHHEDHPVTESLLRILLQQ